MNNILKYLILFSTNLISNEISIENHNNNILLIDSLKNEIFDMDAELSLYKFIFLMSELMFVGTSIGVCHEADNK